MPQSFQSNILTEIKQVAPPLIVQIKSNEPSEDVPPENHKTISYKLKTFHRQNLYSVLDGSVNLY